MGGEEHMIRCWLWLKYGSLWSRMRNVVGFHYHWFGITCSVDRQQVRWGRQAKSLEELIPRMVTTQLTAFPLLFDDMIAFLWCSVDCSKSMVVAVFPFALNFQRRKWPSHRPIIDFLWFPCAPQASGVPPAREIIDVLDQNIDPPCTSKSVCLNSQCPDSTTPHVPRVNFLYHICQDVKPPVRGVSVHLVVDLRLFICCGWRQSAWSAVCLVQCPVWISLPELVDLTLVAWMLASEFLCSKNGRFEVYLVPCSKGAFGSFRTCLRMRIFIIFVYTGTMPSSSIIHKTVFTRMPTLEGILVCHHSKLAHQRFVRLQLGKSSFVQLRELLNLIQPFMSMFRCAEPSTSFLHRLLNPIV